MSTDRPIRVLHVLGALNRAGAETWLMNVLRHIDRERFQLDFVVHTTAPGAYDPEVRALGSRIFPCLGTRNPLRYGRNLKAILQNEGPYDVVHSTCTTIRGSCCERRDKPASPSGSLTATATHRCSITKPARRGGLISV